MKQFPYIFVVDENFLIKIRYGGAITRTEIDNFTELRVIQNTFGIITSRLRIWRSSMIATVDKDSRFTKVCVTLPTFLMKANNNISKQYSPANYTDIGEPFRGKAC